MSYDLFAWPVDRSMSTAEALADVQARIGRWPIGIGRDRRIAAFAEAMDDQFPGVGSMRSPIPMEFDVHRDWIHMALPWTMVSDLILPIGRLAFDGGIGLFDPQRELVALPAPFGTEPLGLGDVEAHEEMAARALGAIVQSVGIAPGDDVKAAINDALRGVGFRQMSPLGFEITPELEAEVAADPSRLPASLQTPERKATLMAQVDAPDARARQQALLQLGGWDPDPEVRATLHRLLEADDVFVVMSAAMGLARVGDETDLEALVATVHRMSPADGGTLTSMVGALDAALRLATKVGPEAVADLRAKARAWRDRPTGARRPREPQAEAYLDQLLGADPV